MKITHTGFLKFLETKTGIILLSFFVTTICCSIISSGIQNKLSENEHNFEMYKIRLNEAKLLQKDVIKLSNSRIFSLNQILSRIENEEQYTSEDIEIFWKENVTNPKNEWNYNLHYLHAQSRVLFSEKLSEMLMSYYDEKIKLHDPVVDKLDDSVYERTIPKTLHGALIDAHATMFYLMKKCNKNTGCKKEELIKLAEKQLDHLVIVQSCFAYRISSELLQYPYGPKSHEAIVLPSQCGILSKQ